MEDQYNKLLTNLEEESQRYASLKGEYTTMELLQEKAEEFITNLE